MIIHLAVLHTDGPPLVTSHAGAELATTIGGALSLHCRSRQLRDARGEYAHGQIAIPMLRSFRLAADLDAGWPMTGAHGRVGLVAMLTAGTRSAHGLDIDVVSSDRRVQPRWLGEHRDRDRARLHATALLGLRNALPSVAAGLAREQRRGAAAGDHERREAGPLFDDVDVKETSARRGVGRS